MIAHTPTLFAAVALVAIILAFCLLLVGQSNRRDNLLLTGCGLLAHALAYVCYTVYGHAPLWLSYGLGNSLLSLALAFYSASLFRIREQVVPWRLLFIIPVIMLTGLMLLLDTLEPRMLLATLVLVVQCSMILYWSRRYVERPGRAHLLLEIGAMISLIGLGMRALAVVNGHAVEMRYDVSNLKQSISVAIGTVTVMMYSIGLVLMAKERSESRLQHLALRDVLTGTFNRRAILERFAVELDRARNERSSLAVAMIDIDHFKRINDLHGHLAGDEVLCHCVRELQMRLRLSDSLGRYGGEEFLLLLPCTDREGAMATLQSLRETIARSPACFAGDEIALRFSVGLWCGIPGPHDNTASLLAQADAALYQAKAGGRNAVHMAVLVDTG
ncbi:MULTISPECIES: GGDEF domain-containing protein [Pseudomonas]|uniref:diguanylate cyclase n=1 Tax=Pseudomonas taiwanensis TaxID=470150 RepID=A0ABR6V1G7_9PSED|nr:MULTISPECIES: GGDEF domain-containing protein [Pseudomonas]AVD89467.1 GGDEF domain-containing protein [Pseudomonas sp. SWI44]MBC3474065.1 GGDEF domain-containing protein [Pseudomonas taiwanensis]MBC3491451.1 GGDEF domain-containing protein [Pseudomonas taiwanensis]MDT8924156.1 diguanylate cyclase [Pseudomonas taiwanensis]MPT01150.1 GGDEF domain-containing protein [Pseudomonas sp.]